MTAKIIQLTKKSPEVITDDEFIETIHSEANREAAVSALSKLFGYKKDPIKFRPLPILKFPKPVEFGTVHTVGNPAKNMYVVATQSAFPNALVDHTELDRDEALRLAASFVLGFSHLEAARIKAIRQRTQLRVGRATMDESLWGRDYGDERGVKAVLPYRLAGRVSLDAIDMEPVIFGTPAPHPAHIAGLENPFEQYEAKTFSISLK